MPISAQNTRTTVVGYDGSEEARAAVAVAIDRSGSGDSIVIVHATPAASSWLGTPDYGRVVVAIQRAGQQVLDEMRPIAEQVDRELEFEMFEGSPAEVIIRVASVREADEIVVGSRGLGRLRAALGSVSQQLLRDADRPVLVVGPDATAALETSRAPVTALG
jgi:nucleotide-binding universal stress UspA family protein